MPTNQNLTITLTMRSEGGRLVAEIESTEKALGKLDRTKKRYSDSAQRARKDTNACRVSVGGLGGAVKSANAALGAMGVAVGAVGFARLGQEIVTVTQQFDTIERGLATITGSTAAASANMGFLRDEADRLGLPLATAATQFTKLAAASRGTNLEGAATREIFTSVSEAATVLGLSGEQLEGALRAIEQTMSKGKVTAEELRGQLSERLPGAVQIMARALGVGTDELDKMLQKGQVTSDALLLFARQLREEFGSGVEEASQRAGAAFARLDNAINSLLVAIGESGFLDALATAARTMTEFVEKTEEFLRLTGVLKQEFEADLPRSVEETTAAITELETRVELLTLALRTGFQTENATKLLRKYGQELLQLQGHLALLEEGSEGAARGTTKLTKAKKDATDQAGFFLRIAREEMAVRNQLAIAESEDLQETLKQQASIEEYIESLEEQVVLLELNAEAMDELKLARLSEQGATADQIERARANLKILREAKDANTEFADTISLIATGFNSLDQAWAETVTNLLNGISRVIAQFQSLGKLTGDAKNNLSQIGAGLGLISTGVGLGRQVGGSGGGILGGALGGGLAGFQLSSGNPLGAVVGALAGGVLGLLGGGGGGGPREPHTRVFLRTTAPGEPAFAREPRGDFRISGTSPFGGFRFSGENAIPADVIGRIRETAVVIGQLDDSIGENLSPTQIDEITDALARFSAGGEEVSGGLPVEESFRARFATIFGVIDEGLGEFFESVTGAASVDEMSAVAEAINAIIGEGGVFSDVSGVMENINVLMSDFADRGETLPEVLARINTELGLLAAVGVDVDDVTTGLVVFAEEMIDALGGIERATGAIGEFNSVFGQTQSGLEATAAVLEDRVIDAFSAIGETFDPQAAMSLDEFNRAFMAILDELSPQEVAEWIDAGLALSDFTGIMDQLGSTVVDTVNDLLTLPDAFQRVQDEIGNVITGEIKPPEEIVKPIGDLEDVLDSDRYRQAVEDQISQAERELELMEAELALRQQLTDSILTGLDVGTAWQQSLETSFQSWQRLSDDVIRAGIGFDGTIESLEALDNATAAWRDAALGVLQDIQGARAAIAGSVDLSAEQLMLEGMTQEQQYEFFRRQAEALAAGLGDLEDPEEIGRVVQEINRLASAALGVADPVQRAQIRGEFQTFFEDVGRIARDQLDEIESDVLDQGDIFTDTIQPVLQGAMDDFSDSVDRMRDIVDIMRRLVDSEIDSTDLEAEAAREMRRAAEQMVDAANTPLTVTVAVPAVNAG